MASWRDISTASRTPGERLLLIDEVDEWPYIGVWMPDWDENGMWIEEDHSVPDHQPDFWMPLPTLRGEEK